MDRSHLVIGFLLGICVTLGVALVVQSGDHIPRAYAQTSGTGEMFAVTGSGTQAQGTDILFVIDSRATRLAVYEYKGGRLRLAAVRNMEYDLRFNEWPEGMQKPSVREMRDQTEQRSKGGKKPRRK